MAKELETQSQESNNNSKSSRGRANNLPEENLHLVTSGAFNPQRGGNPRIWDCEMLSDSRRWSSKKSLQRHSISSSNALPRGTQQAAGGFSWDRRQSRQGSSFLTHGGTPTSVSPSETPMEAHRESTKRKQRRRPLLDAIKGLSKGLLCSSRRTTHLRLYRGCERGKRLLLLLLLPF